MQPEMTVSPSRLSAGRLSPVSAAVSTLPPPSTITPSSGMRSPGRTSRISPTATSSGSSSISSPPRSTRAMSGRMSMSAAIERRLRPTATDWNHSPI